MGVTRFLFSFPWGTLATSTLVAIATGVAVLGLGAPAVILIPVSWGGTTVYRALTTRFEHGPKPR